MSILKISSTMEDYLKVIFRFQQKKRFARVSDVSSAMGKAKSAVTAALRSLSKKGLIIYQPYEPVTLSAEGKKLAEQIVVRHRIIVDFLKNVLDVPQNYAQSAACKMEHSMDAKVLDCFVCFLVFVNNPRETVWRDEFHQLKKNGATTHACKICVNEYLSKLNKESV